MNLKPEVGYELLTKSHQPYTNPPTMHQPTNQASIFDNFHILIACIQIMYMYKLASRISINRANLFVLWEIQIWSKLEFNFVVSLSIC